MIKYLYLFLFSAIIISCKHTSEKKTIVKQEPRQKTIHYPFIDEFDAFIKASKPDSAFPGAAVAIVKDNQVIYLKSFGVKSINTNDSVNIHTIFRLASVSKGFAGILAGIFVHKGIIHLDDPVVKYLPNFKLSNSEYTQKLTIRHILSQTTGLPTHTYTNMIEAGTDFATLRDKLAEVPLSAEPGKQHSYQNVAYSIIADILEKATGKNYETLLNEEIFKPLQMTDASANYESLEKSNNRAFPHINTKKGFIQIKSTPEYYTVLPAAGVNASISDMSKWLLALVGNNPDVIAPEVTKIAFTPEVETPRRHKYFFMKWEEVKETEYGLGWRILKYNADTMAYHGGYVKGYRAEIAIIPKYKIGIVVLSNAPNKFINLTIPAFYNSFFKYKDAFKTN